MSEMQEAASPAAAHSARRRLSSRRMREARDQLTSTSGTPAVFDHELLRTFAQNRVSAAPVLLLTGAIMVVGLTIPFTRFGASLGLQPLPLAFFPWLALTLLFYCAVTQLVKLCYIRKFRGWL